jgi:hypothetical protein
LLNKLIDGAVELSSLQIAIKSMKLGWNEIEMKNWQAIMEERRLLTDPPRGDILNK